MKLTKKVIAALMIGASATSFAEGIEWSGFGSLYYSQAFDNQFLVGGADDNKPDYTQHSLFGLNVGSNITENLSVASQIVMAGDTAQSTNFDMFAQWASLNYRIADGLNVKIGRQLWPVLISSEYQRVHYLLPQSNIPGTSYGLLPFVSFDGISLNKTFETAIGGLTIGAYNGNPKLNTGGIAGVDLDFQTLTGVRATLDGSGWRVHATANKVFSKIKVESESYTSGNVLVRTTGSAKTASNVFSLGYRFDKSNFVSWGEASYSKATDNQDLTLVTKLAANGTTVATSTKKIFEKTYGGYVLAGYRFGKLLPTITYAQGTTYLGLPTSPVNNAKYEGKTESYIAGLAYALQDQATVKFEYMRTYVPSVGGGWYDIVQSTTSKKEYGDAVKAGIDFIF